MGPAFLLWWRETVLGLAYPIACWAAAESNSQVDGMLDPRQTQLVSLCPPSLACLQTGANQAVRLATSTFDAEICYSSL